MTKDRQRRQWRERKQRYREAHADERCRACCGLRDLPGRRCSKCRAEDRERYLPGVEHDLEALAEMIRAAHRPSSRCEVSGYSLAQLATIGLRLEVDRRFAFAGYVKGNMQLLAGPLNRAKARSDAVPAWAVDELCQAFELDPARRAEADLYRASDKGVLWDATSG